MAVNVRVKVTPKDYKLIKSSDYIDLILQLNDGSLCDKIKLIKL